MKSTRWALTVAPTRLMRAIMAEMLRRIGVSEDIAEPVEDLLADGPPRLLLVTA